MFSKWALMGSGEPNKEASKSQAGNVLQAALAAHSRCCQGPGKKITSRLLEADISEDAGRDNPDILNGAIESAVGVLMFGWSTLAGRDHSARRSRSRLVLR